MSHSKFSVTLADISNLNSGRKRQINIDSTAEKQRKLLRNSGIEYIGRNGVYHEDKAFTDGVKKCVRCRKLGCMLLSPEEKIIICQEFWRMNYENYSRQSNILFSLMSWSVPEERTVDIEISRRKATFTYHLRRSNGQKLECCLRTFLDTFQITNDRVKVLRKKLLRGDTQVEDHRGSHQNRPNKHTAETIHLIQEHIYSFPTYISHYTRNAGDPLRQYLEPDLNSSKMYRLFVERYGEGVDHLDHLYKDILRSTKLRFGVPKSDTCGQCDLLYRRICNLDPREAVAIQNTQNELDAHHTVADLGYTEMRNDIDKGILDNSFIVICVDLQQILLSPRLSHGEMYYKRKLSSYNFAVTNPCQDQSTMFFWNEFDGNRGQNDIGSSILTYVRSKFTRLLEGEQRTLTVWSDRCSGQNNNFSNVCLYKFLIFEGFFSEVNQKFLVSGHTFLSSDRHFAAIERAQKNQAVHNPEDWISIIQQARVNQPFEVFQMRFNNFFNISALKALIPKPQEFLVTHFHWIQSRKSSPSILRTKVDYNQNTPWVTHQLRAANSVRGRIINRPEWSPVCFHNFQLPALYENALPVCPEKIADLRSMMDYLPTRKQEFFAGLLNN